MIDQIPDFLTEEENIFIEQAESLDKTAFFNWSIEHPDEHTIIRKLSQGGAKLITGPRGCGKTTLMLKTFHQLRATPKAALPIYVNFKTSLQLEPLYQKGNVNAIFWFNQWLLFKVYQGLFNTLTELKKTPPSQLKFDEPFVDRVTHQLELGQIDSLTDEEDSLLTVSSLEGDIKKVLKSLRKTRCVLLLDDALHAFSPEQQREFFDFFRQITTRVISPKAAIYPGVTIYSSQFQVGHDAEQIDVWLKPESPHYMTFMFEVLERRLPGEVYQKLLANEQLLQIVCYAAFGIPRALLNMTRLLYQKRPISSVGNSAFEVNFNRSKVLRAIRASFDHTLSVYSALKIQLPTYEHFILIGEQLFDNMVSRVKDYNQNKAIGTQSVVIGIQHPLPAELLKVLGFFQWAGLLSALGRVNMGVKGTFETYVIHYAALILKNVLFGKPSVAAEDLSSALLNTSHRYWPRVAPNVLLGTNDLSVFNLTVPLCQNCEIPIVNEQAKFCLNCGVVLQRGSIFDEIVNHDIEELGLSKRRAQAIKKHAQLFTIEDILMDHDNQKLCSVPGIGETLAQQIRSLAEEYIS